ncbi:MAG TPA: three-Cys-motif partner protein TcmP [Candidatus Limnocylindria bacterium]|nr:three-Cys-motif partner protein TcmP [Candidatus Limnocylindria bacterium]
MGGTALPVQFDEIGYWSELKLEIIKKYAAAYSKIMTAQGNLYHVYVDAFAGAGRHISRATGESVPGSPLNALVIRPPFRAYHLIDLNPQKIGLFRELVGDRQDVFIYEGDCNTILLRDVFPQIEYRDFRRALVLLDPYGLDLRWEVLRIAGSLRTVDMFLNFPVMDMNRNVLWSRPEGVDPADVDRMNSFWGDESWREIAYERHPTLFGDEYHVKTGMDRVVKAFRLRLRETAGFKHVADPLPMRNSSRAIIYYLFFASQNEAAAHIIKDIFDRYRNRGA